MAEELKKKQEELQEDQLNEVAGGTLFYEESQGEIKVKQLF